MTETNTTSNGFEIQNPVEELSAIDFRDRMASEYGIDGESPSERVEQLKSLSVEGIAILLEDINKSVQGSADSLVSHDKVIKIGDKETIKPEDRYDVFLKLVESIKECPDTINPARVGDVLALGVVLLHPFHDGNGRTARVLGLMFREFYNNDDYIPDYNEVTEPRDRVRKRGGRGAIGYTPRFPEGFDQSDPAQVTKYLSELLTDEKPDSYIGCFDRAPLLK